MFETKSSDFYYNKLLFGIEHEVIIKINKKTEWDELIQNMPMNKKPKYNEIYKLGKLFNNFNNNNKININDYKIYDFYDKTTFLFNNNYTKKKYINIFFRFKQMIMER